MNEKKTIRVHSLSINIDNVLITKTYFLTVNLSYIAAYMCTMHVHIVTHIHIHVNAGLFCKK